MRALIAAVAVCALVGCAASEPPNRDGEIDDLLRAQELLREQYEDCKVDPNCDESVYDDMYAYAGLD